MTQRLEGKPVAETLLRRAREEAAKLARPPHLVVVLVGDDAASATYVASKERKCQELGFRSRTVRLPATVTAAVLASAIEALNADDDVDGILLQLPLPAHLPRRAILDHISAAKDVDGLHPLNAGRLVFGEPGPVPCTPAGVLELLKFYKIPLAGKRAVVVGRSEIVGKPMVSLLVGADMTVTVAHSRTPDLAAVTREADVLVVAAGKPKLVGAQHVRPGATVVDVGIHRIDGKLVGDVDAAAVEGIAGGLTPVPGGVGPMTIAHLLVNLVRLAAARAKT